MIALAERRKAPKFQLQPVQMRLGFCQADIAIFGGARGGGKTYALLFDELQNVDNPNFASVIFRRTYPEITQPGGLWPESMKLYPHFGAVPNITNLSWRFPSGAVVKFGHLQHDKDLLNWLGAQIAVLGFDQLETFTEAQFFALLGSNRSTCGIRPYVRATANPEPNWLADFLAWWIDQETGFPIRERAGVIRWFIRLNEKIEWADSPEQLDGLAKSVTFIPATLDDNPALTEADPGYLANLLAQPHITRERWLKGNWKVSSADGEWPAEYFSSSIWFEQAPAHPACSVLALDPSKGRDAKFGDYSAFVHLLVDQQGVLWADAWLERLNATLAIDKLMGLYRQLRPQAVVIETNQFQELLATDFARVCREQNITPNLYGMTNTVKKETRIRCAGPFLAQRRIRFNGSSPGAKLLVQQLREFPNGDHDDGPDALEMAIRMADYMLTGQCSNNTPTILKG